MLVECLAAGCAEAGGGARALADESSADLDVVGGFQGGQLFGERRIGQAVKRYLVAMTAVAEATGRGAQPRQLIVTVYGLYSRDAGGWMSVASLVSLLRDIGVDEPAVRSSISEGATSSLHPGITVSCG